MQILCIRRQYPKWKHWEHALGGGGGVSTYHVQNSIYIIGTLAQDFNVVFDIGQQELRVTK